MHILDTDTFTHIQRRNQNVLRQLEQNDLVGITLITKGEILRGRIDYLLKAENSEHLEKAQKLFFESEKLIAEFPIIHFDKKSLEKFDELRQNSKYRKIGRADMLIASICFANQAVLVTRNVKHFTQFPNLEVENWVD
jgi:tRNA(fMet)-specific endonuclease VapC